MAIIEVRINDSSVATSGGDDFDVLVLGIIGATDDTPASVQLTGSRNNTDEQLQWFYTHLRSGDKVQAVLRKQGEGTLPDKTPSDTIRDSSALDERSSAKRSICTFDVCLGRQKLRSSVDGTSTLYATATWHHTFGHLDFELWCAAADDPNQNRFWLGAKIEYDEPVVIEVKF